MYVNVANPVVAALFDCSAERRERALALLQPLAALMLGGQGGSDLEAALRSFASALQDTIREP